MHGSPVVHTDASGEFTLAWEGKTSSLVVSHPEYVSREFSSLRALSKDGEVTVVLSRGATISGRALDEGRQPVSSAAVTIIAARSQSGRQFIGKDIVTAGMASKLPESRTAVTDAEGRFKFSRLKPGSYHLVARKSGRGTAQYAVALAEGEELEQDIELGEALSFRGVVSGPDGPLAGVKVAASLAAGGLVAGGGDSPIAAAVSAADGSYELRELPARPLVVLARAAGYESRVVQGVVPLPGGAKLPVRLEPLPSLEVRANDALTGFPIEDYEVELEVLATVPDRDNVDCYADLKTAFERSAGNARSVDGLCPGGTYEMRLRSSRYAPVVRQVTLASGERRLLEIGLEAGTRVASLVLDDGTGLPVRGAAVTMTEPSRLKVRSEEDRAVTDEHGIAVLAHVPRGEYVFEIAHADYLSARTRPMAVGDSPVDLSRCPRTVRSRRPVRGQAGGPAPRPGPTREEEWG